MNITITPTEATGISRRLQISVPPETVADYEDQAAKKYATQVRLPGFRPGKAPPSMVRKRFAEAIRREVVRVARRFAAHNEDLDVTYNRYGYDTAAWYRDRGIPLAEVGPIPSAPYDSQFCVAEPWGR